MPDDPLPADLREFLEINIDSIAQLEALLLLRENPDVVWEVETAAKRLYVGEQQASSALAHLATQGLIAAQANRYRFDRLSRELTRMVALLAEHYRTHLIPITNLVHAKPHRFQQFADAFKLKKE